MADESTCLAIITARGGSKGVPNKNIRLLNGKPLIDYSIQLGKFCPYVTKTMVSTDSDDIRRVALRCGADVPFLRPAELATDTAEQEDALLHAMAWYERRGEAFDYICLLEPTTPLRRLATLNKGFELLRSRPAADAVFSVVPCKMSPLWCSTLREDRFMREWMDEKNKWLNRQEMLTYYQPAGAVTISKWSVFKAKRTFLHDTTLALPVDDVEALDIDTPFDFFVGERLLERGLFCHDDLHDLVLGELGHPTLG